MAHHRLAAFFRNRERRGGARMRQQKATPENMY